MHERYITFSWMCSFLQQKGLKNVCEFCWTFNLFPVQGHAFFCVFVNGNFLKESSNCEGHFPQLWRVGSWAIFHVSTPYFTWMADFAAHLEVNLHFCHCHGFWFSGSCMSACRWSPLSDKKPFMLELGEQYTILSCPWACLPWLKYQ
jgi:hypothetical protein